MVRRLTRNEAIVGSNPTVGTFFFAINHSVRLLFLLLSIEYYTFIARPALLDLINLHDYERETFDGGGGGGVASATSPNCTSDAFDLSSSSFMKLVRSMFALGLVCFFLSSGFWWGRGQWWAKRLRRRKGRRRALWLCTLLT